MLKKYKQFVIALSIFVAILFVGQSGIAQNIKFNPIKPTPKAAVLTDEQQGILAVRIAKASVVNIVGSMVQATTTTGASLSVTTGPNFIYATGFVLEADGLIVSNNHVVENPNLKYTVILADGTEYPAKVLGLDKFDDVGLLKIDAKNLVPAKLGDSSALETGQSVFAIGDSLGQYQYTVTRGVVSGLGRTLDEQTSNRLHNLIQTDAAINPGNSGGPLINLNAEVVGMNTLIDTSGQSLGFAVPINIIKDAVSQLKTFGKVSRAFLGIKFLGINPALLAIKKLPVTSGAYIVEVSGGTPASTAGLQATDIITAINNISVTQNKPLDDIINSFPAGTQVTLKVLRGTQTLELPVVLGQQQ